MVKEKVKNNRYSYIRALACVGIVFLHMVYGAVTIYGNEATELPRMISWMVVNNLYWAVPCFVMVTGALLLDPSRELSYKKLFSKYIFRVAAALLIFTVLYRVYDIFMNGEEVSADGLLKGIINFFTGGSWSHLWYLYMLIGLYLLMPFFKKITERINVKELSYFLVLIVIFISIIPVLKLWNIEIAFGIPVATIYPFYLFFGYTVSRPEVKIKKWVAVLCLILSTAALVGLTWLRWENSETMASLEIFFNYSSVIVVLQAVSIFYLFVKTKNVEDAVEQISIPAEEIVEEVVEESAEEEVYEEPTTETVEESTEDAVEPAAETVEEDSSAEVLPETLEEKKKKENIFKRFVLSFDGCTFGIYLVHMFLARYILRYMDLNPYENIPLFIGLIVATILVSYFVVWVLRKIPKVNKVL